MMKLGREYQFWFKLALVWFIFAGLMGTWMRYGFVGEWPEFLEYNNLKHGHSHVAMLGWLYSGLYVLIVFLFELKGSFYRRLFWLTQIPVLGMFISFPIQGYKSFSIIFVSIHLLLTYAFIFAVFRDLKTRKMNAAGLFLKTALILMFVSSLGTWALAGFMGTGLKGSAWYYGSIQFYLHFQFNGWFVFGCLALFFRMLELKGISVETANTKTFYYVLLISAILTFALAVTWSTPIDFIFWLNSIGAIIQLLALFYFIGIVRDTGSRFSLGLSKRSAGLFRITLLAFIIKILIQTFVAIPYLATVSYTIRNFVLGFIHLLVLGCISLFILAVYRLYQSSKQKHLVGIDIFIVGFLLSELLLFLQGFMLWMEMGFMRFYYEFIFIASVLMPLGIIYYFIQEVRQPKTL